MDLRRSLALVKRWGIPSVALALVMGGATYVFLSSQPPTYEASATLRLGQSVSGEPILNADLSNRIAVEYAFQATTPPVLERVIANLGLQESARDLQDRVSASAATDSALLTVTARAGTAADAADLADAVADELIALTTATPGGRDIEEALLQQIDGIEEEIEAARTEIARLRSQAGSELQLAAAEGRLTELRTTLVDYLDVVAALGSSSLTSVVPAESTVAQVPTRALVLAGLAAILGFALMGMLAAVVEYLDDRVRDGRAVERLTGVPALASIVDRPSEAGHGRGPPIAALVDPGSSVVESYRALRVNMEFAIGDQRPGAILVTSAQESVGKALTVANLAVVFAQTGRRVILVDADLRRPSMHTLFQVPNGSGLATILRSDEHVAGSHRPTAQPNLRIITSGPLPPDPTQLLGSDRMRSLMTELAAEADVVILDSPPLSAAPDAAILGSFLRSTLLVVDLDLARRDPLDEVVRRLALARARVVGVVLFRDRLRARPGRRRVGGPSRSEEQSGTQALDQVGRM